jgi:hypothetical protein
MPMPKLSDDQLVTQFGAKPGELIPVDGINRDPGALIPIDDEPKVDPSLRTVVPGLKEQTNFPGAERPKSLFESVQQAQVERAQNPTPEDQVKLAEGLDQLEKPLLNVSPKVFKFVLDALQGPYAQGAGQIYGDDKGQNEVAKEAIATTLSRVTSAMTSPRMIGETLALGVPGLRYAPLVDFAKMTLEGTIEGGKKTVEGFKEGDLRKTVEGATETGLNVAGAKGLLHAAKGTDLVAEAAAPKSERASVFPSGEMKEVRDPKWLGFNPDALVPTEQLNSRLKTQMPKTEYEMFNELGLQEKLKPGEKVKASDMASWMEDVGPSVEIKKLEVGKQPELPQEYVKATEELSRITHELDTKGIKIGDFGGTVEFQRGNMRERASEFSPEEMNYLNELRPKIRELQATQEKYIDQVSDESQLAATERFTTVNPKELDQMPGAVDILVKSKQKGQESYNPNDTHYGSPAGDNLIAHVRGYMETTPEGKKVFHVFEIQSDAAQNRIKAEKSSNIYEEGGVYKLKLFNGKLFKHSDKAVLERFRNEAIEQAAPDHPLLKHYERLAVKAAIEHARKEGADAVAFSDAETAMLTEGLDRDVTIPEEYHGREAEYIQEMEIRDRPLIAQEKGMRLHYDQTIPKIAKELTGDEGKVVEFRGHKNAMIREIDKDHGKPRKDLIFLNPDGTPKTSITARQYSIANARPEFTMFGSDKPAKGMQLKQAVEKNREAGMLGVSGPKISKATKPIDAKKVIQDFQPKDEANLAHMKKYGLENVPVLGRLMGTKAKIKTPWDVPVATWRAEHFGGSETKSAIYHQQIKGEFEGTFKLDEKLRTGFTGKPKLETVFKRLMADPKAYPLTKEQRRVFENVVKPTLERIRELRQANGLNVKKNPWGLSRLFYKNPEGLMVNAVRKLYRDLAMQRLKNDPALMGTSMAQVRREIDQRADRVWQAVSKANSFTKVLRTGFDFGAPLIQGLPTLFVRTGVWTKANVKATQAFFNEGYRTEYFRKNTKYIEEMAQQGMSVGSLQEHRGGLGGVDLVEKGLDKVREFEKKLNVPEGLSPAEGTRALTEAFSRHFQTFLDVAKVELWKVYRNKFPKDQWQEASRFVDALTMSGRMESAGLSSDRALVERAMLYAPMYYRASIDLLGGLVQKGQARTETVKALTGFLGGSVAAYYGIGLMLGMNKEELNQRMNPTNSQFMMWTVDDGDEGKLNVGFGNVFKSYARLAGGILETISKSPENLLSGNSEKNPLVRWLRGHSSPVVSSAWTLSQDRDYMGLKKGVLETIGSTVVPMSAEAGQSGKERAAQLVGLNAYKGRGPTAQEVAAKFFPGRKIETLSKQELRKVDAEVKAKATPRTLEERELADYRRHNNEYALLEKAYGGLTKDQKEYLKKHNVEIKPFETTLSLPGSRVPGKIGRIVPELNTPAVRVPLPGKQREEYEKLVVQFYRREVATLMREGGLERLPQDKKQDKLSERLKKARADAMRAIGR